jgi:hypothetical protein
MINLNRDTSEDRQGVCPVCKTCGDLNDAGEMVLGKNGDTMEFSWTCDVCKAKGKAIFALEFVRHEIKS